MADSKLSELTAVSSVANADIFYVVVGGNSRKVSKSDLLAGLADASHTHTKSEITDFSDSDYVQSDPSGISGADAVANMVSLTDAEYSAISSPDASTFYIITDA